MLDKIKSIIIIIRIFKNMRNKRKLQIIKYNKRLYNKLDIEKKDFKVYEILQEFNKKYNTNIEDIDLREINLNYCSINNGGLKYFKRIVFKELNKLILSDNKISSINIFEKVDLKKLKKLNLSKNKISDINSLKNINFKELNLLDLSENKISDINILEKVNFEELKILNLSSNKI